MKIRKRRPENGARELLERAVAMFGSENRLAQAIGTAQQNVNRAVHRGSVSADLAIGIHQATDGEIGAHELRPDLWQCPEHVPLRKKRGKRHADHRGAP